MNEDVFSCNYSTDIASLRIRQILILAIMAAEMQLGQEIQERDGRYRLEEKERRLDIDTSTGFGKTMAHYFRVLIAEMYLDDEYVITGERSVSKSITRRRRRR